MKALLVIAMILFPATLYAEVLDYASPPEFDIISFNCKLDKDIGSYRIKDVDWQLNSENVNTVVLEEGRDCASAFAVLFSERFKKISNKPYIFKRRVLASDKYND